MVPNERYHHAESRKINFIFQIPMLFEIRSFEISEYFSRSIRDVHFKEFSPDLVTHSDSYA